MPETPQLCDRNLIFPLMQRAPSRHRSRLRILAAPERDFGMNHALGRSGTSIGRRCNVVSNSCAATNTAHAISTPIGRLSRSSNSTLKHDIPPLQSLNILPSQVQAPSVNRPPDCRRLHTAVLPPAHDPQLRVVSPTTPDSSVRHFTRNSIILTSS
jgi:hypothetical protein